MEGIGKLHQNCIAKKKNRKVQVLFFQTVSTCLRKSVEMGVTSPISEMVLVHDIFKAC